MANGFQVTPSQLNATKEGLEGLNQTFNNILSQLIETEEALDGQWEGEAKKKFQNAFKNDVEKMRNFHTTMTSYIATLGSISAKYSSTEAENVSIIK